MSKIGFKFCVEIIKTECRNLTMLIISCYLREILFAKCKLPPFFLSL